MNEANDYTNKPTIDLIDILHEELQKVMIYQAFMHTSNSTHTNAPVSSVEPLTRICMCGTGAKRTDVF